MGPVVMGSSGTGAVAMGTSGTGPVVAMGTGGGTAGAAGGAAGSGVSSGSTFPSVADPTADGTFNSIEEASGADCTVFRPMTLGDGGLKHPVIVWGNGTINTPDTYSDFFLHLASHGFIVIAANTSNAGSGMEMLACLDYIIMQNTASGTFQGKVDVDHIGVAGYSQGGCGTLMAALDDRFVASAPISPYIVLPLGGCDASSAGMQKHPMFLISGDADTVAVPDANQTPVFMQAMVPIVWGTLAGATHFEVLGSGGGYRGPVTAWFRYKLMNDPASAAYFKKDPCTLCKTAGWTVQFNSLWKD